MPALDEAIVRHLAEHGPLIESAVAALASSDPRHVNAALLRLRSSKRVIHENGVHWRVATPDDLIARPAPIPAPAPTAPPPRPSPTVDPAAAERFVQRVSEMADPAPAIQPVKPKESAVSRKKKTCSKCGGKDPQSNGYCGPCSRAYAKERYAKKKKAAAAEAAGTPAKAKKPRTLQARKGAAQPAAASQVSAIIGRMKERARQQQALIQPLVFNLTITDEITGDVHQVAVGIATAKALSAQLAAL